MSIQAMSWALQQQVVTEPTSRLVLICLANYAGEDGKNAFPSIRKLCEHTGLSRRSVISHLDKLQQGGLISPGNPGVVGAHIERADRRPMNYDICLQPGAGDAPRDERGANGAGNGVQMVQERGAGDAPEPLLNRPSDPKEYTSDFEVAWKAYPKRSPGDNKKSAYRQWRARLNAGHSPQVMTDGVRRYARYVEETGTGFVKMAQTFLGPDEHFLLEWEIPDEPNRNNRKPNSFDSFTSALRQELAGK